MNKKITITVIVLFIFLSIGIFKLRSSEPRELTCLSKVNCQEFISKGLIPEAIPVDAFNITLQHSSNNEKVWLVFKTEQNIEEDLDASIRTTNTTEQVKTIQISEILIFNKNKAKWWPEFLNNQKEFSKKDNLKVYKYDYTNAGKDQYFVVERLNEKEFQVYYWSVTRLQD